MKKRLLTLFFALCFSFILIGGCGGEPIVPTSESEMGVIIPPEDDDESFEAGLPAEPDVRDSDELPPLYKAHEEYFSVGVALSNSQIRNPDKAQLAAYHFNSFTAENEMKPDAVLDQGSAKNLEKHYHEPLIKTENIDRAMKYAIENDMQVRYHTLVWHSQTPKWFFTEDYHVGSEPVSREVMLARMESFIKQVLEYMHETYPGMVYAVDVVNEAIASGSDPNHIRTEDNPWYDTVGPDYAEHAFRFARKYAADYMKLYYNDYNAEETAKSIYICNMLRPIIEEGNVDGMGLQSHHGLTSPNLQAMRDAIERYSDLGLEIQFTELDINTTEDDDMELAKRYKGIVNVYYEMIARGVNITNVTLWGLSDDQSWLNKPGEPRYPLLFDRELNVKEAFWGFYRHDSIPNF